MTGRLCTRCSSSLYSHSSGLFVLIDDVVVAVAVVDVVVAASCLVYYGS